MDLIVEYNFVKNKNDELHIKEMEKGVLNKINSNEEILESEVWYLLIEVLLTESKNSNININSNNNDNYNEDSIYEDSNITSHCESIYQIILIVFSYMSQNSIKQIEEKFYKESYKEKYKIIIKYGVAFYKRICILSMRINDEEIYQITTIIFYPGISYNHSVNGSRSDDRGQWRYMRNTCNDVYRMPYINER
ncbi:hypothetical protein H8356DRAFT_1436258 [Neocallimastix lanati (nom. inval.)]|nr:hypothetical protein H8356DRAFT_1436258 [Neocallimastix sp. JGI-2020a]